MREKEKQELAYRQPEHLQVREGSPYHHAPTYHLWYQREGRVLAYCHVGVTEAEVELLEVEVRPGHRGLGLVRQIFEEAQGKFGKPLVHHGQYTEAGITQVAPYFNSRAEQDAYPEWAVTPLEFYVKEWDSCTPRKL